MVTLADLNARDEKMKAAEKAIVGAISHVQNYIHKNVKAWSSVKNVGATAP